MANQRILATEEMVGYGHATKADTLNRLTMVEHSEAGVHGAVARASMGTAPLVLGSDADGDMYYRASSALARLAKSTANYKLFMNAAATGPEWASGVFMKSFTRAMDAVGAPTDVAITGVGFKPSAIINIHGIASTKIGGIGLATGAANQVALTNQSGITAGQNHFSSGYFAIGWEDASKYQIGSIKSFDADGFTLTWTKAGSPTAQNLLIYCLCFR